MANHLISNLSLLTCQIFTKGPGSTTGTGTGFFFGENAGDQSTIVLVTNRHVIEGADEFSLRFNLGDNAGRASLGSHYTMNCGDPRDGTIYHPDGLDLAVIAVGGMLQQIDAEGHFPAFTAATPNDIATDADGFGLAEDVLMVGYPIGLSDKLNNRPIVRRGITATDYAVDYEGRPEFMIDAACFPGSSGSPIVVASDGPFRDAEGNRVLASRFKLLGILWGGPIRNVEGEIRAVPVPTSMDITVTTPTMLNLGFCIKARELRKLFAIALERRAQET